MYPARHPRTNFQYVLISAEYINVELFRTAAVDISSEVVVHERNVLAEERETLNFSLSLSLSIMS